MRNDGGGDTGSILFGTREQVGVGRGLGEFRAGRPLVVTGVGETLLCLPVEGLDSERFTAFSALCAPMTPRLVLTGRRFRTQERNREDVLERLAELIRRASKPPTVRRPTKPSKAARVRRREEKARQAAKKRFRRSDLDD